MTKSRLWTTGVTTSTSTANVLLEPPEASSNNLQQIDAKKEEQPSPKQVIFPKKTKRSTAGKEHWIWVPKIQAQTKSTTHTVASSKNRPPRTNQKFSAGKEQWVWKKKSELKEKPMTHTENFHRESEKQPSKQTMQWVRKDRLTHSRKGRTSKPKTRQPSEGVPRPQQRN